MCRPNWTILGNDITTPVAIESLESCGTKTIVDSVSAAVPDHFTPNKDICTSAEQALHAIVAKTHHIRHYFEG